MSNLELTEGRDRVLVSGVEHVSDGDTEEAGEHEDGEGDDDDERGVADDAVAPSVVRGELHEHGAQEGPREEALAAGAHPALEDIQRGVMADHGVIFDEFP